MKKTLLILAAILLSHCQLMAYDFSTIINGTTIYFDIQSYYSYDVTVVAAPTSTPYSGAIVIPDSVTYNGETYHVTTIGSSAFANCTGLTSVTIPQSVTLIDQKAFSNTTGLTTVNWNAKRADIPSSFQYLSEFPFYNSNIRTVVFGDSVRFIPNNIFHNCDSLRTVTLSDSISEIEWRAFEGCKSLTSLVFPNALDTISYMLCEGCTSLTTVTLGNNTKMISDGAFYGCTNLSSIDIHDSVIYIGSNSFYHCFELEEISLPKSLRYINHLAFDSCINLTQITIPENIEEIGVAFNNCSNLRTVHWNAKYISDVEINSEGYNYYLFTNTPVETVIFGDSVRYIPAYIFYNIHELDSISFGENITHIGDRAFYNTLISQIAIPQFVTEIGSYAFANDSNLTTIYWNAKNASYYDYDYHPFYLDSITTVIFGDSVKSIPNYAFNNFESIDSLVINENIQYIGNSAFRNCIQISELTLYPELIYLGSNAFAYDTNIHTIHWNAKNIQNYGYNYGSGYFGHPFEGIEIQSVIFSDSVQTIPSKAFQYFENLNSVVFGKNIESIGYNAFNGCDLDSIVLGVKLTTLGGYAFSNNPNLSTVLWEAKNITEFGDYDYESNQLEHPFEESPIHNVIFGNYVQSIPTKAFNHFNTLQYISLGRDIVTIGDNAFSNNSNLHQIFWNSKDVTNYFAHNIHNPDDLLYHPFCNTNIKKVTFGHFADVIPYCAFPYSTIDSLVIGKGVYSIKGNAFFNCSNLSYIKISAPNPPQFLNSSFEEVTNTIPVYVPCGSEDAYKNDLNWSYFKNIKGHCLNDFTITVVSNNEQWGTVTGGDTYEEGSIITIQALENEGYHFECWNDGNTDNPRMIEVTRDSTFTATFAIGVDIDDLDMEETISIYPNPTTGLINISTNNIQHIDIYNIIGKHVAHFDNQNMINITNLMAGQYTLRIQTSEGSIIRKIIKK